MIARPRTLPWLAPCLLCLASHAQVAAPPPTFESASIRPAPADSPVAGLEFMIGMAREAPPRGLLTMTGPLAPFIMFAYNVQDEVEARAMRARLPEWAQQTKYTIIARPPEDEPTLEQVRTMMRSLLEERFALKAHHASHTGPVNLLTLIRPGATGPGLRPHDASRACAESDPAEKGAEAKQAVSEPCGLVLRMTGDGIFHVSMVNVTLPEACTLLGGLGGVLGGRGMDTVDDSTGLAGRWDITFDFVPDRSDGTTRADVSGETFTGALEKQLGLRLKKGTGPVEDLVIDHIAPPTPD